MSDPWHQDPQFIEYARHVIDELVPMIGSSAVTVSLVPTGEPDVKFAVELGFSIMFDKPIVLLVQPGTRVPGHLAKVADAVVEFDPDHPEQANTRVAQVLNELLKDET